MCCLGIALQLYVNTMFMFILHRNRYTYLKVSSQAHRPQLVFLTAIMPATVQLSPLLNLLGFWLGPADPTNCSCSSSLLAAYKRNETLKVQLQLYILVISSYRDQLLLLISGCSVNEVKVGILSIIASYSCDLFQNYFKGAKIWWLFTQLYKNSTDSIGNFVLKISTWSRFQNYNQQYCRPKERK